MTARQMREHVKAEAATVAPWIDWEKGVDQFLAGDPDREITGVAVCWLSTRDVLERAQALGANLLVTHEPLYLKEPAEDADGVYTAWVEKKRWLAESGLTVYRCHDYWDDYPGIGIHGAWARWLGYEGEPVAQRRYYEVHETGGLPLGELAARVLEKVRPLGQETLGVVGDAGRPTQRIALGTGAITQYAVMRAMGADVLLLTDDGTRLWESAQWARDAGVSLLLANHATAEEPGMATLTRYLGDLLKVPAHHIPAGCLYQGVWPGA